MLEVLFSIFVLSIGLLSLAALIPVGKFLVLEAGKFDRSALCGQGAIADIQARRLLQPGNAVDVATLAAYIPPGYTDSVAVDPWFIAANSTAPAGELGNFPYGAGGFRMPRVTLWPGASAAVRAALAQRIFVWTDDPIFNSDDPDIRPQRTYSVGADLAWGVAGTDDDSNGTDDDASEAGWAGSDDSPAVSGEYTWLCTVAPAAQERPVANIPASATYPAGLDTPDPRRTGYTIAVVVFYKRERLAPDATVPIPAERVALADITGGGIGGGDIRLRSAAVVPDDWFKLRSNGWLLLAGWSADPNAASVTLPQGTGLNRRVFRWYRIAAVANDFDATGRDLTLAGPDMSAASFDLDTNDDGLGDGVIFDADNDPATGAGGVTLDAYLFNDIAGVYETTVRLD